MRHFLELFPEKFIEMQRHGSLLEKLKVLAKWMGFRAFSEMRHFLQVFPEKFIEMQRHGSLFEKLQSFGQIDDFSCFFTN